MYTVLMPSFHLSCAYPRLLCVSVVLVGRCCWRGGRATLSSTATVAPPSKWHRHGDTPSASLCSRYGKAQYKGHGCIYTVYPYI